MTGRPCSELLIPEIPQEQSLFFTQHRADIARLFTIVGLPPFASESLEQSVDMTQPWVKGDHSRPLHQFAIPAAAKVELGEIYTRLSLAQEQPLAAGHYNEIWVLGATQHGNNRRSDFLKRSLAREDVTTNHIVLMGGQREVYPERETDDIQANLDYITRHGPDTAWLRAVESGKAELRWETDLMRLAAAAQLGEVSLRQLHLRLGNRDPIWRYEMEWQGIPVTLMHSLAVTRNGEPRHNTESCVQDWLRTMPPTAGSRIGLIAANPHLERMVRASRNVVSNMGRSDLQLVAGGSAAPSTIGDSIYLGEVARSLYEDLRATNRH